MTGKRTALAALTAVLALVVASPAPAMAAVSDIRDRQWHLGELDVARAHKISQGAGVTVAVIDSGVDATHPDLAGSVLSGVDITGLDAASKGRKDTDGHGTAMAGLIAAHGKALGIAPKAKILPVRDGTGLGAASTNMAKGIDWAVAHGATVLCIAQAGPSNGPEREAVQRAMAADVVVVAGVGNKPRASRVGSPAVVPGVIAAAGTGRDGGHAAVSVTGAQVVLAAPGDHITSIDLNHSYSAGTGTSNSTAIIAGAAALVRSKFPDLPAVEVVHRLTATADDKGPTGRDEQYGYGIVNLVAALTADVPALPPNLTPTAPTTTMYELRPPTKASANSTGGITPVWLQLGGLVCLLALTAGVVGAIVVVVRRGRRNTPPIS